MASARIEFSAHAVQECRRRGVDKDQVLETVRIPEQRVPAKKGRVICQRRFRAARSRKVWLLRVIVKREGPQTVIITAYRTAKVAKYWQGD